MGTYEILKSHGLKVIRVRVIPIGIGRELDPAIFYSRYGDYIMLDTHGESPSPLLRDFIGAPIGLMTGILVVRS